MICASNDINEETIISLNEQVKVRVDLRIANILTIDKYRNIEIWNIFLEPQNRLFWDRNASRYVSETTSVGLCL